MEEVVVHLTHDQIDFLYSKLYDEYINTTDEQLEAMLRSILKAFDE